METALTLLVALLRQAKAAARKFFRSRLKQPSEALTEKLNEVYAHEPSLLDPGLEKAQYEAAANERW